MAPALPTRVQTTSLTSWSMYENTDTASTSGSNPFLPFIVYKFQHQLIIAWYWLKFFHIVSFDDKTLLAGLYFTLQVQVRKIPNFVSIRQHLILVFNFCTFSDQYLYVLVSQRWTSWTGMETGQFLVCQIRALSNLIYCSLPVR